MNVLTTFYRAAIICFHPLPNKINCTFKRKTKTKFLTVASCKLRARSLPFLLFM